MRLLVTRPAVDGERTAEKLRARGHDVLLAPLLQVEMLGDAELGAGPWAAVAITSANAAYAVNAHARRAELSALPAYAVGRRTAAAARAAGFAEVASADGGVDETPDLYRCRRDIRRDGRPKLRRSRVLSLPPFFNPQAFDPLKLARVVCHQHQPE